MSSATVKDVAKEAGVSVGTVSRYLNGQKLKEENMISVQKAITKLGYKENLIAKGLKTNTTKSVGVVVNTLTDIFATTIVTALESILEQNDYSLIICDYQEDLEKLKTKLEFLKSRNVDALVLFHVEENLSILDQYREENIPIISIDCPTKGSQNDVLVIENANSSYDILKLLYDFGHRRIGIIAGNTERYTGRKRYFGCEQFYKDYGIKIDKELVYFGEYQKEDGYKGMNMLLNLSQPPTAIYATNYYMTIGALQAIFEHKLSIPDDISVIGFDYVDIFDAFNQKITMIEQPLDIIGEKAGELILDRIKNHKANNNPRTYFIPTTIHKGDSIKNRNTNGEEIF